MPAPERAKGVGTEEWAPWGVVMGRAPANTLRVLAGRRTQLASDPVFRAGITEEPANPTKHSANFAQKLTADGFFLDLVIATVDAGRPTKSAKIAHCLCDCIRPELQYPEGLER